MKVKLRPQPNICVASLRGKRADGSKPKIYSPTFFHIVAQYGPLALHTREGDETIYLRTDPHMQEDARVLAINARTPRRKPTIDMRGLLRGAK